MSAAEYFATGSKKGRGMARRSIELIEAMYTAAEAAADRWSRHWLQAVRRGPDRRDDKAGDGQGLPATERGARSRIHPWEWIVDETRTRERVSTWADPAAYARTVARSYRRDFWNQQPVRVEVWSEKGTIRGVLAPVLNQYAVGFRVMDGFSSATSVHDVAGDDDGGP